MRSDQAMPGQTGAAATGVPAVPRSAPPARRAARDGGRSTGPGDLAEVLRFTGLAVGAGEEAQGFDVWGGDGGGYFLVPAAPNGTGRRLTRFAGAFPDLRLSARLRRRLEGPTRIGLSRSTLHSLLDATQLGGTPGHPVFRIAVPGAYRKITLSVVDGGGHPKGYAKLPAHPGGVGRVEREADMLRELADSGILAGSVPVVRSFSTWRGLPVLSLGAAAPRRAGSRRFGDQQRGWLTALHRATVSCRPLAGSRTLHRWNERLAELDGSAGSDASAGVFRRAIASLAEGFAQVSPPATMAHGDFVPWNTRRGAHGLFVFDWETALSEAIAGHDAFQFVVLPHVIRGQPARMPDAVIRWLEGVWPPAREHARDLWVSFLVELGLHYAVARARRPQEGKDTVVRATVAELETALRRS